VQHAAPPLFGDPSLLSIIQAAGWPIWPLLLCSVLALAIIIERGVNLQTKKIAPSDLLEDVLEQIQSRPLSINEIENLKTQSFLGQLIVEGLALQKNPHDTNFERTLAFQLESKGKEIAAQLEKNLSALATLASASPLLGLLGTVIGMIEIFASQSTSGSQPADLGLGISMALYNTAMGLVIAIPALIAWRTFRSKVDGLMVQLEVASERLLLARLHIESSN
jgi:biopolymer transport protein ExbB